MKKLLSIGVILSLLLALLTGCQSPGPEQDLGDKFILGEDNQYYYRMSRILASPMVESEESIYIVKEGYIYSKNKKTGEIVPLCNKPDCMHDDSEFNDNGSSNCNAYVGVALALDYYHNKLYFITAFRELYEMDKSGTTRKRLMQWEEESPYAPIIHRGYLYVSFTNSDGFPDEYTEEEKEKLSYRVDRYRIDRWDGKPETIYEKKGAYGQINVMFAYGNQVYMPLAAAPGEYGTIVYDILEKTASFHPEIRGYAAPVDGKLLHYVPSDVPETGGLTQEERNAIEEKQMAVLSDLQGNLIQETEIPMTYSSLFSNSTLIAADNESSAGYGADPTAILGERKIRFYDTDAKLIREIKLEQENLRSVIGMNEDFLIYSVKNKQSQLDLWSIDLHRLDDPNLKGEPFFVSEE